MAVTLPEPQAQDLEELDRMLAGEVPQEAIVALQRATRTFHDKMSGRLPEETLRDIARQFRCGVQEALLEGDPVNVRFTGKVQPATYMGRGSFGRVRVVLGDGKERLIKPEQIVA